MERSGGVKGMEGRKAGADQGHHRPHSGYPVCEAKCHTL